MGLGNAKCDTISPSIRFQELAITIRTKDDHTAELTADAAPLALTPATSLVVCAGIPRSGSTWLYNAVRLLLQREYGENHVYGTWIDRYDATNTTRWHVVKIHDPSEPLAWRAKCVLTSRRDLRDIAASAWKRGWIGDAAATLDLLDRVTAQHAFWNARATHEMVYERMRHDPRREVAAIARTLSLALDDNAIDATVHAIELLGHDDSSADDFDHSNLLHKQHIMDGRVGYHVQMLPAELLSSIHERYGSWLTSYGYRAG